MLYYTSIIVNMSPARNPFLMNTNSFHSIKSKIIVSYCAKNSVTQIFGNIHDERIQR